jgi:hypothetical protein
MGYLRRFFTPESENESWHLNIHATMMEAEILRACEFNIRSGHWANFR